MTVDDELQAARAELQRMVAAEGWEALCPRKDTEQCDGSTGVMNWWLRCPAAVTTCPHLVARREYACAEFLLTLPVYARRPKMEKVPEGLREGKLGVKRYCETIGKRVPEGAGVTMLGPVGCGKTCALALIGIAAVENWVGSVLYVDAAELFNALHEKRAEVYFDAALFLLDDMGKEYSEPWAVGGFHRLVEHRRARGLATCLSTNLSAERLRDAEVIARIIDRFIEVNSTVETQTTSQREPLPEGAWDD